MDNEMDDEMEYDFENMPIELSEKDKADLIKTVRGMINGTTVTMEVECPNCKRKWVTPISDETSQAVFECLDCGTDCIA